MTHQDAYQEKIDAQLKELDARIKLLEAKAEQAEVETKMKYERCGEMSRRK